MNLLASTLFGGLYLLILFGVCFGCVAGAKALRRAQKNRKAPPERAQPEPKEQKEPKPPQTVYYLVEKKRARPKTGYKSPKEIRFQ